VNGGLLSALGGLVIVVLVLVLAWWFTKYVAGRLPVAGAVPGTSGRGRSGVPPLRILGQIAMGRDQRLLVVQAGRRVFLMGAVPTGITVLAELSGEEAEEWITSSAVPEALPSFQEALKKVLKKK